ncbi:MAG: CRTAC1 family protein [Planctomycetota bacterium]|jgi:hypothetical protein
MFIDVALASGIDFVHRAGRSDQHLLPEIMGGGAGFLDVDGDGLLDAYLVQSDAGQHGSRGNRLFRNLGDGTFADVTETSGADDTGYGMGCAAGDYDDDGDVDLYVTNLGDDVLYRNDGDGSFTDVTLGAGIDTPGWSTSAAFVDYDADGDLDLFVTSYVRWSRTGRFLDRECFAATGERDYCSPQAYDAPSHDTLYENLGDGTFRDVSGAAGIASRAGTGLGVICTDLDGDGRVDLYVANDQMPSFAWINLGAGRFEERAALLGVAVDEHGRPLAGMGVDAGDFDRDGDFDLWKVHLDGEAHTLYVNAGTFYDDATVRLGLAVPTRAATGFGTAFVDLDLDGRLDLFVANGRVQRAGGAGTATDPYAEANQVLLQTPAGRFVDASERGGAALRLVESSRGAAFADFDEDGDVDVLVCNNDGRARLLRNETPATRFLAVRVLEASGRDALGAVIRCSGRDAVFTGLVHAASSYCSTSDARRVIGLGTAVVTRIDVTWADGTATSFTEGPYEGSVVLRRRDPS